MPSSPLPLEHQPPKNPAHLIKGRFRAELGHSQHVGRFGQFVDLIVVGQVKADFHLVHRHCAIVEHPSLVVPQQPRVNPQHMFIVRFSKGLVGQVNGLIKKGTGLAFCHRAILAGAGHGFHSYFPRSSMKKIFAFSVPETTGNSHDA